MWKRNAKKKGSTTKKTVNCCRHRGNEEHALIYAIVTVSTPSLPKIQMLVVSHYKQISHFNDKFKGTSGSYSKNEKEGFYIL